jgi:hypothetical protein
MLIVLLPTGSPAALREIPPTIEVPITIYNVLLTPTMLLFIQNKQNLLAKVLYFAKQLATELSVVVLHSSMSRP